MRFLVFPLVLVVGLALLFYFNQSWKAAVWKKVGLAVVSACCALAAAAFVLFLIQQFLA